ncbi:transposase [Paraburkholderia dipogonis]
MQDSQHVRRSAITEDSNFRFLEVGSESGSARAAEVENSRSCVSGEAITFASLDGCGRRGQAPPGFHARRPAGGRLPVTASPASGRDGHPATLHGLAPTRAARVQTVSCVEGRPPDSSPCDRFTDGVLLLDFAPPSGSHMRNVNYLGRYIERPPLSQSRLKHYDGRMVAFDHLTHRDDRHRVAVYETEEFIARFIQHIPDKHFRMINFRGFLANRGRDQWLPRCMRCRISPSRP